MKLTVDRLGFGYPGKPLGRHVSLTVTTGEVLCLLGPNGSGKTTLFKTLLGLLPPQGGTIALDGNALDHWSRRRLAQCMAYVPQAHTAYFPYTVLDIVLMGRTAHLDLFAAPSRRDIDIAEAALQALHIAALRDEVYTQISGGQRQLVMVARALAQEPAFLVLDEPTASLDFGNQVVVLKHIQALAQRGIGIILSTHDPDHAFACADRVALLCDGGLLCTGSPREVMTPANLHRLYGVEVDVMPLAGSERWICVPQLR
ncbi:MAG: ABC transporter ATP-binding protein [Candidatus Competibacteraceae bacterium]